MVKKEMSFRDGNVIRLYSCSINLVGTSYESYDERFISERGSFNDRDTVKPEGKSNLYRTFSMVNPSF